MLREPVIQLETEPFTRSNSLPCILLPLKTTIPICLINPAVPPYAYFLQERLHYIQPVAEMPATIEIFRGSIIALPVYPCLPNSSRIITYHTNSRTLCPSLEFLRCII